MLVASYAVPSAQKRYHVAQMYLSCAIPISHVTRKPGFPCIRKIAFYFSATLVILILGKAENKTKVATSISYVLNLYKLRARADKSVQKVQDKLGLKLRCNGRDEAPGLVRSGSVANPRFGYRVWDRSTKLLGGDRFLDSEVIW